MSTITTYKPEQVVEVIREYITEEIAYDQSDLQLTNDFHLVEQGVIDSMGILRVISFIEEQFDFVLEPEDLMIENFSTIDAITQFILGRLNLAS